MDYPVVYEVFRSKGKGARSFQYRVYWANPFLVPQYEVIDVHVRSEWAVLEWLHKHGPPSAGVEFVRRGVWDSYGQREREVRVGKYADRMGSKKATKAAKESKASPADTKAYPALSDVLWSTTHADGSKRATTTLLFVVDDGSLRACLNDRDGLQVAFVTLESLTEALAAVERHLQDDSLDWREKKADSAKKKA